MKKIRKAVIPAAGYGTRFLPATKATPKEMLPIVDKPTIQFIVEEALESGIEEILIISGHAKRAIEDHFDSAPTLEAELEKKGKTDLLEIVRETADIRVHYIRQRYMRGLGDAVYCAWDHECLEAGTDYFAYKHYFYYRDADLMVISNYYPALLKALKDNGIHLELNVDKATVLLSSCDIHMLRQNFTRRMTDFQNRSRRQLQAFVK